MPLVSVLMPVFNRETLVSDAVRSIQNQTLQDWELIILDDASTDRTLEICQSFESEDKRIRVIVNEKNLGVGASRNRLVSYAGGKYIANHDSDDVSTPDRFACEVGILETNSKIGLVSGIAEWIDDEGNVFTHFPEMLHRGKQYPQDKKEMVKLLYLNCVVANPACMFRRNLIEGMSDPYGNYRIVDDWHFLINLAHRTLMWGIPKALVLMRRGKNHFHLWKDYGDGLKEVRQFQLAIYHQFKDDQNSPIDYWLYRKGMAQLLTNEGRSAGGLRGYSNILLAILYDPSSERCWKSVWEFSGRVFKKASRIKMLSSAQ